LRGREMPDWKECETQAQCPRKYTHAKALR
jgi:hypothetical protein